MSACVESIDSACVESIVAPMGLATSPAEYVEWFTKKMKRFGVLYRLGDPQQSIGQVCNDTERIQHDVRQFGLPPSPGSHPINLWNTIEDWFEA